MVRSPLLSKIGSHSGSFGLCPHRRRGPRDKDAILPRNRGHSERNGGALIIILGDFNARVLTNPGVPRHVGPNIFQSDRPLGDQSEDILENRDLFLDFLIQHDLVALNALMPKPPADQITFKHPGQPDFSPPWVENNFAQINYILTKCRFGNLFADV